MKFIFSIIFLVSVVTWSQEEKDHVLIKGKVVTTNKKGVKEPVPGAKIKWAKGEDMALSQSDGSFSVHAHELPDTLFIKFTGYKLIAYEVKDPSIDYEFNLREGVVLNGVVVIAEDVNKNIDLIDPFNVERIGSGELRKAACCNLSESFETNASVDVNMTDAVSGAKKIQMLGLDGVYTQLQWENIPLVRGLSTSYGLNFTPGTWIESIQITKGTGSVTNGYESMAGMINLEMIKPLEGPRFYLNLYGNKFSRAEVNFHGSQIFSKKWSTMTFLHLSHQQFESDVNNDGFRDMPIGFIGAFMHRWQFEGKNSEAKFGIKGTFADKQGGQLGTTVSDASTPSWFAGQNTEHLELFFKNGYFLKNREQGSIGIIAQLKYHHMANSFGLTNYEGVQRKGYLNVMYGDMIKDTRHKIKTGVSFILDDYNESYNDSSFLKTEIVPGAFFEYTYNQNDNFILVAGVRGDYHNLYGPLFAPRMHAKWNIKKLSALRFSAGRGLRVPNPYADYLSNMASSRLWIVDPNLRPEDCISTGVTFVQKFATWKEVSSISFDYFYTHFFNAVIADMDQSPNELHIYSTNTTMFSHSVQAELSFKPVKGLELRAAFKFYDVQAEFGGVMQQRAFVPRYRALFNAGYTTRNKKWSFDVTGNFVGRKRLPSLASNPEEYQRPLESETYWLLNSQITHNFKRFSVYVGGENLLNVIQSDAIISADDPFGSYFDATQVWAPISGFNVYGGIHFEIGQKAEKQLENL